jgi:hypothetical protein
MSLEAPSESMEDVFRSWFITAQGVYILDPDLMPMGLHDVIQNYLHLDAFAQTEEQRALAHQEASGKFEVATGYKFDDFLKYRIRLNRVR